MGAILAAEDVVSAHCRRMRLCRRAESTAPSLASLRHSAYRREEGRNPTGYEIVEAWLKEAEPAVAAFAGPEKQAETLSRLQLDRDLLEYFAVRGRNMTAHNAAKGRYGLN